MTDAQIFQIFGIVYLAIGLGIIINPNHYRQMLVDFAANRAVMYLGGAMAFVVGFLLITFHNIWTAEWGVIITVIGWLALIKGLFIFLLPKMLMKACSYLEKNTRLLIVESVLIIIFGGLLVYLGFFACCLYSF
ncbi:MAG: hypothetical protein ISS77_03630 [Phycisphaerae bacterium]|nr:hypothetical protein [Phycisphaerae bacterium]